MRYALDEIRPDAIRPAFASLGSGSALEKPEIFILVGEQTFLQYETLTLAERLGYFKAEDLKVTNLDLRGSSQALQSIGATSTDFVAGLFDHLIQMQAKHQAILGLILFFHLPGIVGGML